MIKISKPGLFNTAFQIGRNNHEIFEWHKYNKSANKNYIKNKSMFKLVRVSHLAVDNWVENYRNKISLDNIITLNRLFEVHHNVNVRDITLCNQEEY